MGAAQDDATTDAPLEIVASGATIPVIKHGQGSIAARTISATFQFENKGGVSPLLGLLPEVIHIAKDADQSALLIRDVAQFLPIEHAAQEPGAALMISRVIDVLIIRCIRTWAKSLGSRQGWVGALADARISRAVAAHTTCTMSQGVLNPLLAMPGGLLADHVSRRTLMITTDAVRAAMRRSSALKKREPVWRCRWTAMRATAPCRLAKAPCCWWPNAAAIFRP